MMNLLELGGLLKKEREKHGLSLRDVMEATKISRRNLNALEGGEIGLLPHPVYLKGYIRNYAHLVGLEAEPLVAVVEQQSDGDSGYVPQIPSPAKPVTSSAPPISLASPAVAAPVSAASLSASPVASGAVENSMSPEPPASNAAASDPTIDPAIEPAIEPTTEQASNLAASPASGSPAAEPASESGPTAFESQIRTPKVALSGSGATPGRRVWLWVVLLVLAGVAALMYVQFKRIQAEVEAPAPAAAPAATAPALAANASANASDVLNTTGPEANATAPAASEPEPAASTSPAPAAPAVAVPAPAASAAKPLPTQNAAPTASPAVSGTSIEVSRKGQAAAAASGASTVPATEVRTPGMQQLVITAKPGEACWVEVIEGARRKTLTLKDGGSTRFEFSSKAKVRLGNAGGVTFQLNGAPYPYHGDRGSTANLEISAH